MTGENAWNGSCQLIRQKIECQYVYWLNEPTVIKHPKAVSLGTLPPQLSSGWAHGLLEPHINLTRLRKPSTFVFPALEWNAGPLKVSYPAKCLLTEERTCRYPQGLVDYCSSHLTGLPCPSFAPLQDVLHRAGDRSFWKCTSDHITSPIILLKASLWV